MNAAQDDTCDWQGRVAAADDESGARRQHGQPAQ
jgi:hypothetical protein